MSTLIDIRTRERRELPPRPIGGVNPYQRAYFSGLELWAANCRAAAEFAAQVFGGERPSDTEE